MVTIIYFSIFERSYHNTCEISKLYITYFKQLWIILLHTRINTEGFKQYCLFGKFRENFIFANSVKRRICKAKIRERGMIYLYQ